MPNPTPTRPRELPVADGFGSLTLAPAPGTRRPTSRFFCLEAPLSWRPARAARSLSNATSPAANEARPSRSA